MQRGKVDAVATILRLSRAENGLSKKELQIKLDLPANLLNEYLAAMVSKNLVEYVHAKRKRKNADETIRVTDRGIKFLELYDAVKIKYFTIASARK